MTSESDSRAYSCVYRVNIELLASSLLQNKLEYMCQANATFFKVLVLTFVTIFNIFFSFLHVIVDLQYDYYYQSTITTSSSSRPTVVQ